MASLARSHVDPAMRAWSAYLASSAARLEHFPSMSDSRIAALVAASPRRATPVSQLAPAAYTLAACCRLLLTTRPALKVGSKAVISCRASPAIVLTAVRRRRSSVLASSWAARTAVSNVPRSSSRSRSASTPRRCQAPSDPTTNPMARPIAHSCRLIINPPNQADRRSGLPVYACNPTGTECAHR